MMRLRNEHARKILQSTQGYRFTMPIQVHYGNEEQKRIPTIFPIVFSLGNRLTQFSEEDIYEVQRKLNDRPRKA